MANEAPKSFDFTAHDKQFHNGRFVEGKMKCKFRDQIKKYESADRLDGSGSGDYSSFKDDAEDFEALEAMIAKATTPQMKKYLESVLKQYENKLNGKTQSTKQVAEAPKRDGFGPNKPLAHDESAFPSGAAWEKALADYGGRGWHSAGSGSTSPHYIDFNGKRYFVKKAGFGKSTYSEDAAQNEVNANNFIRLAGFNAPDSKFYETGDGAFAVSLGQDLSNDTLDSGLGKKGVKEAVRAAYPLMSLMYNMDLMQNSDNAYVGPDGKPLFLDNGSTFGYSAQGARNKYYDFDDRNDPFPSKSISGGLTGLLDVGNGSSANWKKALGSHADKESILKECAKYEMGDLVREAKKQGLLDHLPKKGVKSLEEYADKLDKLSSKYKKTEIPAPTASTQAPDPTDASKKDSEPENNGASASTVDPAVAALASKYGISGLTMTTNQDGTVTIDGTGNVPQSDLLDFVTALNQNGFFPGYVASLTQGGQIQTTQGLNNNVVAQGINNNFKTLNVSPSIAYKTNGSYLLSFGGSFASGLTSSQAVAFAHRINSTNAIPGYAAAVSKNAKNGKWEITLYPANSVQQPNASSSSSGSGASSPSSQAQQLAPAQPKSKPKPAPAPAPAPTQTPAPAAPASTPATTPAPNINTQTPQQVASQVAQMPKAAAGAFVQMLQRRLASPNLPQGLKTKYQNVLNAINGTGAKPVQPTTAPAPASSGSATLSPAAQALTTPLAKRLQAQLAKAQPGTPAYATIANRLNTLANGSGTT